MSITPNYYPYYRATSDYAYETACKAETTARAAQQTANNARGLHKDLDERTRNIEGDVRSLQAAHNIGIGRLERLEQRIAALEPKPAEPTRAELIAKYIKRLEDANIPPHSSDYVLKCWFLGVLKEINRAP